MNTNTGRVYTGVEEVKAAQERGEPLVILAEGIARQLTPVERLVKLDPEAVERMNQIALTEARFRQSISGIPTLDAYSPLKAY